MYVIRVCILALFVAWEITVIEQMYVVALCTQASGSEYRGFHAFSTSTISPEVGMAIFPAGKIRNRTSLGIF